MNAIYKSGLTKDSKIYIAGHRGLVGSAIKRNLESRGFKNIIGRTHKELDLLDPSAVRDFFDKEQPDAVVLAAAHVGGIMANLVNRADFIFQNLQIQQNVIGEAWRHGVKKLVFLGSTCIYPREAPQPMTEDVLLTSELEYTNEPYAIAKIAGLKLCESLNLQYGTDFIAVMPTNLYGPGDNFHLEHSHVMPGMVRKMHLAKLMNLGDYAGLRSDLRRLPVENCDVDTMTDADIRILLGKYGIYPDKLELWGTGKPLREFLWSEDMADATVHVMLNVGFDQLRGDRKEVRNCHINIGTGKELSIAELAELVRKAVGYEGRIAWNADKPDGTLRKLCNVDKIHRLGWHHKVELNDGVRKLYDNYLHADNVASR